MAWWGYRRRRWRPWRRRRWAIRRRRPRRTVRRRGRRRYVSRRPRRRYRRRLRRGRRKRGRRRKHRETLILRQWQPDIIKTCFITGWMPAIICGTGNTQFNFVIHEEDIPPRGASYGGNFANYTFSLAGLYDQYLLHRNKWSRTNQDLELARYLFTTIKLYRHESVDYIATYNRTGPFQVNPLSYMFTHPLLMLLSKHHIVVPSLKTKPRGKRYKKIRIKAPKLMLNKWYFARDICDIGLFQLSITGLELSNPWLRSGTNSPVVGFYVLKNSYYDTYMSNLAGTDRDNQRKTCFEKLYPPNTTPKNYWEPTYTKLMSKIYIQAQNEATSNFKNKPYNWQNYKDNYSQVRTKWLSVAQDGYNLVKAEYKEVYTTVTTFPPDFANRNYLSHDYGIFSPYFLTPTRYNEQWHTAWTYVRYNPLADRGIGNRIYCQWCSESSTSFDSTKSKCVLSDMPLYMLTYGYLDYVSKCTGSKSAWTDMRVAIRCPYTKPALVGSEDNVGFIPLSTTFMNGDLPWPTTSIPVNMWFKWYPMIMHQKGCLETIVSCGPFMPRDQEANSWDITMGYKSVFKWGGSPLPPQPVDDPCKKGTFEIPDPDKHPPRIQISNPQTLGPQIFHTWDIRRGLLSSKSIKRVSEYSDTDENFSTGVVHKKPRMDTKYYQTSETQEEDVYSLLKSLQKEQETSSSEEEQAPQKEDTQRQQLLQQLQLQRHHQRVLRKGLQHLLGDVLRLRKGVHFDPTLL
nr:MAG: ORF1 [Torque teno virus]